MKAITAAAVAAAAMMLNAGMARAAPPSATADKPLDLPLQGARTEASVRVTPDNEQMARNYPPLANMMNLRGSAAISCTAGLDGYLRDCRVLSETPAGLGFGAAAIRVAADFRMKPAQQDGRPIEAKVTIPIAFQLGGDRTAPTPTPIPPPTTPAALPLARQVVASDGVGENLQKGYQQFIDQMSTRLATDGDPKAAARVLDAYRQGVEDAIAEDADRRARLLAAHMTEADLRATVGYLQSPAGVTWRKAEDQVIAGRQPNVNELAAQAAARRLCASEACEGAGPSAAAASPP